MSILRWVLRFGPDHESKFHKHKRPVNGSWRVDETYLKISGEDKYLYRAVDKRGNTVRCHQIEIRQCKYLNNIVEQDHRFIKKRIRPMLGFKNFHSAKIILSGVEVLRLIFKNQSGYLPLLHQNSIEAYWGLVRS